MDKNLEKQSHPQANTVNQKGDPLQSEILAWLQGVRFKKKTFGGVDESDVWKKIGELTELYEHLLLAQKYGSGDRNE